MSRGVIAEAISFYDGLLQGDVLRRTHEAIERVSAERKLLYRGRLLHGVLRPHFITSRQQAELQRATLLVHRALDALYKRACRDEPFRRELRVQEWEELLMPVDAESPMPSVMGRLDGFLGPDGTIRFIEFNTAPGGMFHMDSIGAAFAATPALETFSRRYDIAIPRTAANIPDALRANHALTGRSGPPRTVFFGPMSPEDTDEEQRFLDYFQENGLPYEIVTSEDEWAYRNGRLFLRDLPVDVVTFIGAVGFGGLIVGCGPDHPVMRALTEGAAWFMNGLFRCCVLRSKVLFAALSQLAESDMFEPEVRAALVRHIPWTRVVREGTTRFGEKNIDLLPYIAEHRERFVLKPANEYGGTGVMLGWHTDADAWSAGLKQALEESWVVQERVPTPRESYPVFDPATGALRLEEFYSDLNPYVWNGSRQEGFFTRLSEKPVVNVAMGGCVTPLVVINER